jgi:DNA-binding NtrC family response regulator
MLAEPGKCRAALSKLSADHLYRPHCEALLAFLDTSSGTSAVIKREALEKLRTIQEPLPRNHGLLLAVLLSLGQLCVELNRLGEAQRSLRLLQQLGGKSADSLVQANLLLFVSMMRFMKGDFAGAYSHAVRGCRLLVPAGSGIWYRLRLQFILTATSADELVEADRVLGELEADPPHDSNLAALMALRKARLLFLRGNAAQGLAFLDSLSDSIAKRVPVPLLNYRVSMLLAGGRTDEAQRCLAAAPADLQDRHRGFLQAKICLARGDIEGVREHSRRAIAMGAASPLTVQDNAMQLAQAELAAGQTRAARTLLRLLDPHEKEPALAVLWAVLHMREGRLNSAATQFRKVLQQSDPRRFRETIRRAAGLTCAELAVLWTRADELPPEATLPAQPVGPSASEARPPVLVGEEPAILEVRARIAKYAPLGETVLITGETGTGKELVARMLHEQCPRANAPFVAVNCAAISDTLIESELFGHAKGAFTGATVAADGLFSSTKDGTMFLDEVSSMSPRLQAALLRVLENGEIRPVGSTRTRKVQCRVIAASNQPLDEMIARNEFRADLYYRLARLHIHLPPLRERKEDIPLLVRHFLQQSFDYGELTVMDDLFQALAEHSWPGNVRELRNELERILLLSGGGPVLHADHVSHTQRPAAPAAAPPLPPPAPVEPRRSRHRLDELRDLFAEHRKLTRAEVVKLLDCSPNTATAYLKTLEQEKLIRRVHTSAALRTSYFVLREEGARRE